MMAKPWATLTATAGLALLLPAVSIGQNKNCCCKSGSSSTTASRTPGGGRSSGSPTMPSFSISAGPGGMPTGMRGPGQPRIPHGLQQNPQLQAGILQHQQFQQGMLQEVHNQYLLQNQIKQQLLQFAFEAPTENLQRELKNSNAFVRWAASVELNRRWKVETALAKKEAAREELVKKEIARQEPVVVTAAAPARSGASLRAAVTPVSQTLFLQIGIPKE